MPDTTNKVTEALIKQRRLGTRDANLVRSVRNRDDLSAAPDRQDDTSTANLNLLRNELDRTRDPFRRQVLEKELKRITGTSGMMAGSGE